MKFNFFASTSLRSGGLKPKNFFTPSKNPFLGLSKSLRSVSVPLKKLISLSLKPNAAAPTPPIRPEAIVPKSKSKPPIFSISFPPPLIAV